MVEEMNPGRHEFLDGEIYAMAGGTMLHAALSAVALTALATQLAGGFRTYTSDLRVRVLATGLATYPDVTLVCGKAEADPELKAVVYVWQDRKQIEVRERTADGDWRSNIGGVGTTVAVEEPRFTLDVNALYAVAGA